jgi:hypothetical protein
VIDRITFNDFNDLLCRDLVKIDLIKNFLFDFSDICLCGNHVKNFDFNIFIRKSGVFLWKGFKYA